MTETYTLPTLHRAMLNQLQTIQNLESDHKVASPGPMYRSVLASLAHFIEPITPSPRLFRTIVRSNSTAALHVLLTTHGKSPYRDFHTAQRLDLNPLIKSANIDALRLLHRAGLSLCDDAPDILRHAFRHNREDGLHFVRQTLGQTASLLDMLDGNKLENEIAPAFANDLGRDILARSEQDLPMFLTTAMAGVFSPKLFAIQVASRIDIAQLHANRPGTFGPRLRDIIAKTASVHGRLSLDMLEPSMSDILERPRNATFFGISASEHAANTAQKRKFESHLH